MKNVKVGVAVAAFACVVSAGAPAATLDFTAFGPGFQGTTVLNLPEATVTGFGTDLFIGGGGIVNSICSIDFPTCQADLEITFMSEVSNLSFDVGGFNAGDFVAVSAFDTTGNLLGTFNVNSDGSVGFGGLGGIGRIFFDDSSMGGGGAAYGNFSFDQNGAVIPLPAAGWFLLSATGALLAMSRRRWTQVVH